MTRALVWFKRDLRLADHAPLHAASQAEVAWAVVMLEPAWLQSPECHPRHVAYLRACVAALADDLARCGLALRVEPGTAVAVLDRLHHELRFTDLYSHEETGPGWSYDRDRAVARWCRAQGVRWTQWPQTGVVRGLQDRRGWAGRWQQRMDAPLWPTPTRLPGPCAAPGNRPAPDLAAFDALTTGTSPTAAAGEAATQSVLRDFLGGRALGYRRHLSSPLTAETGCSRLSEHLAFGTVSVRQVHQATERAITEARQAGGPPGLVYALRGFAGRLRWHCHFVQKLEDEPAIEWRNFARSADGLRPGDGRELTALDRERLAAWREGRTGFPMVDACMRQLVATGWLNFRMRALLVSFAAYHLWLHWREPGLFLARQFLDFEPGIHWSQMQMQSGTTGINTLRIYSPAKQARDHDPEGTYVRRWVPEWGRADYPPPLVDERVALARAKELLYTRRREPAARDEAQAIQQRHGSRRSGLPPSGPSAARGTATQGGRSRAPRVTPTTSEAPDDDPQGRLF